jgi:hypothetical protein
VFAVKGEKEEEGMVREGWDMTRSGHYDEMRMS